MTKPPYWTITEIRRSPLGLWRGYISDGLGDEQPCCKASSGHVSKKYAEVCSSAEIAHRNLWVKWQMDLYIQEQI